MCRARWLTLLLTASAVTVGYTGDDGAGTESRDRRVAPADETTDPIVAELVAICREVAKDRQIAADDNLFEVGVSSLTLTELVLAVDEKYPGKLDISDLFDYPTLRDIAALLQKETR